MTVVSVHLAVFDQVAASYRTADLTAIAEALAQLPLLIRGGDGTQNFGYGFGADPPIVTLLPAALSMIAGVVPANILTGIYRPFLLALQQELSQLGYPSIDAYLTAQNAAALHSCLVHPYFAQICYLFGNQQGNLLLSPGNVFAPITQFGAVTVGGGARAAFVNAAAIPTANVVVPGIGASAQGYTPAPGLTASVTTAINGTLTLSLMASGQDRNGNPVTNRLWTAVLDNLPAGSAPVAFTPAVAGDRLSQVTAVTGAGTATAGAVTLTSTFERAINAQNPAAAPGTLRFVAFEMPTGAVDGVNKVFTALHPPVGGMAVYLNGQPQDAVTIAQGGLGQVTLSSAAATFAAAPSAANNDYVRLSYFTYA